MSFVQSNFNRPKQESTKSGAPRLQFVDLAKGVCILLVLWSHCFNVSPYNPGALTLVRMPLYFVLSGMFFKEYGSILRFLEKKLNNLIIPFLTFGILGTLINSVVWGFDISGMTINAFFYVGPRGNGPLWFLLSLFWCNIIYLAITICTKNEYLKLCSIVACALIGVLVHDEKDVLPRFTQALLCMPMFVYGYYLRSLPIIKKEIFSNLSCLIFGISLILLSICVCLLSDGSKMIWIFHEYEGSWAVFYIVSLLSVTGLLMICKGIGGWLPIVSYFGRYSIIVLVIHWFFVSYVYFPFYCFGIEISPFILFVLTFFLSWLSIPVLKAWVPGLVAQKEWVRLPRIENLRKMVRVAK